MTPEEFERTLRRGSQVTARWISAGKHWSGRAVVVAIYPAEFKVTLAEQVGPFTVGRLLKVPRHAIGGAWCQANRLASHGS